MTTALMILLGTTLGVAADEVFHGLKKKKEEPFTAPFSFKEVSKHPERFRMQAEFENECFVVRIKRKENENANPL